MADEQDDRALRTRRMPDGGEVVSGPAAERALDAVGARAMTLDHTILVRESFDPADPGDQALYAHERHHQQASGGADAHHGDHDEEERQARTVEQMVLHRRSRGEDLGAILDDTHGATDAPTAAGASLPDTPSDDDPMAAYRQLRAQGLEHEQIVRMLAREVVEDLLRERDELQARGGTAR